MPGRPQVPMKTKRPRFPGAAGLLPLLVQRSAMNRRSEARTSGIYTNGAVFGEGRRHTREGVQPVALQTVVATDDASRTRSSCRTGRTDRHRIRHDDPCNEHPLELGIQPEEVNAGEDRQRAAQGFRSTEDLGAAAGQEVVSPEVDAAVSGDAGRRTRSLDRTTRWAALAETRIEVRARRTWWSEP